MADPDEATLQQKDGDSYADVVVGKTGSGKAPLRGPMPKKKITLQPGRRKPAPKRVAKV